MRGLIRRGVRALLPWLARENGNIAVITAIMLPVIIGGAGIGFETAGWYQTQRAMQNAADSAAIAAATNAGSSYSSEADAVTAAYGFTNGTSGVVVTTSNAAACPAGGNTCYSVSITKPVPLYLMQILGFHGNTTLNGNYAEQMSVSAIAAAGRTTDTYCLVALNANGTGITTDGSPKANLNGCDIFSNNGATCNGHDLDAGAGDAHHTATGCGSVQHSNLGLLSDPYSYLATSIPSNPCSPTTLPSGVSTAYPQEPGKKGTPLPNVTGTGSSSNVSWGATPSGSVTWGSTVYFCGDVQLSGDLNVTTPAGGTVMVIENGQLDTNGFTIQTQSTCGPSPCTGASGLTIVFTSPSGDDSNAAYTHAPTGGGTLDIAAPTTGTWKGVAIYQDPNVTAGVDISAAGNSPTWDLTGLVYLPNSSVTLKGAVNKSTNGYSCFTMITGQVLIDGTGYILDEGQCTQAGLTQPSELVGGRGSLVG